MYTAPKREHVFWGFGTSFSYHPFMIFLWCFMFVFVFVSIFGNILGSCWAHFWKWKGFHSVINCMRGSPLPHPREIDRSRSKGWVFWKRRKRRTRAQFRTGRLKRSKTRPKWYQNERRRPKCFLNQVISRIWFTMQKRTPQNSKGEFGDFCFKIIFDQNALSMASLFLLNAGKWLKIMPKGVPKGIKKIIHFSICLRKADFRQLVGFSNQKRSILKIEGPNI